MFDFSIWEVATVGVVALVVIGPERLPKVARTAGHLFGRLQRYVATVKADINREIEQSELAKVKQEVQDAARSFEHSVQEHAASIEKEAAKLEQSTQPETQPALPPAADETPVTAASAASEPVAASAAAVKESAPVEQMAFDFGIEPVRPRTKPS
ncbi:MAG: twin-arginine translocase subunit TatB [Betaproteobacteria bacterium]|nr:twin-arginine translocase subunit TatB [Betaproteobacteria bacterium]